jgi:signal transduction histidine kinase
MKLARAKHHIYELSGLLLILLLLVIFLIFAVVTDRITQHITDERDRTFRIAYAWRVLDDRLMHHSRVDSSDITRRVDEIGADLTAFVSNPLFRVVRKEVQNAEGTLLMDAWTKLRERIGEILQHERESLDAAEYEPLAAAFERELDQVTGMYDVSYANQLRAMRTLLFFLVVTVFLYLGFSVEYVSAAARKQKEIERSKDFVRAVMEAQDDERRRIARDLHDGISQDLAFVKLSLQRIPRLSAHGGEAAPKLQDAEEKVREALASIRRKSYELLPPALDQGALIPALEDLSRNVSKLGGVAMGFSATGMRDIRVEKKRMLSIYRIAQEACANVYKHSGADSGRMSIAHSWPLIILKISDNGRGIPGDRSVAQLSEHSLGIRSMMERADMLGGTLAITNGREGGVIVRAEIPLVPLG